MPSRISNPKPLACPSIWPSPCLLSHSDRVAPDQVDLNPSDEKLAELMGEMGVEGDMAEKVMRAGPVTS